MKKITTLLLVLCLGLSFSLWGINDADAKKKKKNVEEPKIEIVHIRISNSDAPDIGDPYVGREVSERALQGSPATQQTYSEDCQEVRCQRAKDRQLSEGTTWKDDVNSGKAKYPK